MKRNPLKRKSELKRGTSQLKRSGMKRKRAKPRPHENREVTLAYLDANPVCELIWAGLELPSHWFGKHADRPVDPHHIISSMNQRHDDAANLLTVCRPCHNIIQHDRVGLVLCLVTKKRKGELNWARLSEFRGRNVFEWVKTFDVPEQFLAVWRELVE